MWAKLLNKVFKIKPTPKKVPLDIQPFSKENSDEIVNESDRGCVLVGAAVLEQRLEDIYLEQFERNQIPQKLQRDLFNSNGPLSTFSSKIKLAYSLGYIDKSTFHDLEAIRKIRNEFAHTSNQVDFINHSVSKTIESLHCVKSSKGEIQRYSPKKSAMPIFEASNIPIEVQLRGLGYIKYTKSLFSLGVRTLEIDLLRSLHALKTSSVKLSEKFDHSDEIQDKSVH
jgi:DNA-binding MltR family transcriptional regulator